MIELDINKLNKLHNANDLLDKEYGKRGTSTRDKFEKEAIAFYYGEVLKNRRKELHLTQESLANKIGLKREYIAKVEKGKTDIQLSSFICIARALGLNSINL